MIRVVENHDWVIYTIIGIIISYIIVFKTLHRDISLSDYIIQPFENSNNNNLSWVFITILFSLSFSILFSQYIPIVPKFITEFTTLFGFELNKIGFMFLSLLIFYFVKNIITYLLYGSLQEIKKYGRYSYIAQKYYIIYSIVILIMSLQHYYLPINKIFAFKFYVIVIIVGFILKLSIYLFHNQKILLDKWYYKFLYICTLQILPALVIWKFWFL